MAVKIRGRPCHILILLLISLIPTIGSRSIILGDEEEGSETSPLQTHINPNYKKEDELNNASSPCSLPTTSASGVINYDVKFLMRISHPFFDVSAGFAPGISYQLSVEVENGWEFIIEWWSTGGEERGRVKRRHQRERRDAMEILPTQSHVTSCSKNSLGGVNRDGNRNFTFNWLLNQNPSQTQLNVLFRLRFRSIFEASSSVFEQNLSLGLLKNCDLRMDLVSQSSLSLSTFSGFPSEGPGLNCTLLIIPREGFGLQVRLNNLSIYGIRDLCKGRFLSVSLASLPKPTNFFNEFPSDFDLTLSRKYCGKIEDYNAEEQIITFPALVFMTEDTAKNANNESAMNGSGETTSSNESELREEITPVNLQGVSVVVSLPGSVKLKESLSLSLVPLSPCQRVVLSGSVGKVQYDKHSGDGDECSISIHVPYGNRIETKMSLGTFEEEDQEGNSTKIFERNPYSNRGKSFGEDGQIESKFPSECTEGNNFLRAKVEEMSQRAETIFCFDGRKKSFYRKRWISLSNHIRISFKLLHFESVEIEYEAVRVEELTGNCERGWVSFDFGCLSLHETGETWGEAEENCQALSGHLVTIRNQLVEQKVQKIITESPLFQPSRAYWIGANDRESEGNFQWSSGLPFIYKNWFPGWRYKGGETVNAQPNDDGFSGQDCVELRQKFSQSTERAYNSYKGLEKGTEKENKFHWNDRNCKVKNFYLCERSNEKAVEFSCNRTLILSPSEVSSVSSPGYPSSYPDNVVCIVNIVIPPGHRMILEFDEFVLEDSPSCKYDSLEIQEVDGDLKTSRGVNKTVLRHCGDWSKKLKLLRYESKGSSVNLKFESDFSHNFPGFKARGWAEKDLDQKRRRYDAEEMCVDQHMEKHGDYCYLFVTHPPVTWNIAHQICSAHKGNMASVLSIEEWLFFTKNFLSSPHYDKKVIFWLGGSIDQNSQLVWTDQMPFNFSAFHPSDLQTISDWKCLSVYWHDGGHKGDFAWRLAECNQASGYVCKKNAKVELKHTMNRTFSGTGGKLSSPNYPGNYYNHLDYSNHLSAPPGTQIVIRFSHLDLEFQEDCLYDYVEIIDQNNSNATRYCGNYQGDQLAKLDYVSTSNEVEIVFHSDFSGSFSGFEMIWRAVDVTGCLAGRTILTGIANGFPLHEASLHSPNFPHFNLPHLDCLYTIVAPAGHRIWLSFQIFELGKRNFDCAEGDHVAIDLGEESEILLCGNQTGYPTSASFVSSREKLRLRVFSPEGKTGRGFLARFKAVQGILKESFTMATTPNTSFSLTSLNYPLKPPKGGNLTLLLTSPPNYLFRLRVTGNTFPNCHFTAPAFLEIHDPYVGPNGTSWIVCQPTETYLTHPFSLKSPPGLEMEHESSMNNIPQLDSALTLRSSFNRLDLKQVYKRGPINALLNSPMYISGNVWNAEVITTIDEKFREKVIAGGDRLLLLNACSPNPCANGGTCITDGEKHICKCLSPYTGPFCGLSLCDMNPCLFGDCFLDDKRIRCECQAGYAGPRCDRRRKPCDEKPCIGHGDCIETSNSTYKCLCHAWWEGPTCEARMQHIPYKPLSERMLQEPFWLGLITVTVVLGIIGLVWCLKRHFPEKLEKLLNDDSDRNRGISWVSSGRSPSSTRIGTGVAFGTRETLAGPLTSQPLSPVASRSFLGRFGIRKPSLLSLSSANSAVSVTAGSPHTYENRTFSLDDLLRPSRSMIRTPSPHRRRNFSMQMRRSDPAEKQLILQQLISSGTGSLDGENKPSTPKPTIAEIIQMSEKRLRLASASSALDSSISLEKDSETSFIVAPNGSSPSGNQNTSQQLTPSKAEKKVTFARLLDKLTATEMSSSSSCSDISCPEDKPIPAPPKLTGKKERKGRFRRSKTYTRGRNSETDQDGVEMSSSDTTPDPIYTPRFPSRLMCGSPTGLAAVALTSPGGSVSAQTTPKNTGNKMTKMASADSLLALFRRFSGQSSSAPPSPQYSENEESSAEFNVIGATPLSTPSSPRNSNLSLSIRPPSFLITSAMDANNMIEVPVIDPFNAQTGGWRTTNSSSITLEVPLRDYCLSPIHEVPTPMPTPTHSPAHTPLMGRPRCGSTDGGVPRIKVQISSEDDDYTCCKEQNPKKFDIPIIAISIEEKGSDMEDEDEQQRKFLERGEAIGESEVIPDVLIHVPPDAVLESKPDPLSPPECNSPTKLKNKPPPLVFANEILSNYDEKIEVRRGSSGSGGNDSEENNNNSNVAIMLPVSLEYSPFDLGKNDRELSEGFKSTIPSPCFYDKSPFHSPTISLTKSWDEIDIHNETLLPSSFNTPNITITINQSSEAESDSDTPGILKLGRIPNLTFLSPFVGSTDRVPSESNLSTSGYSSMASPCPSRCPSVSPLCPSESEDYHHHSGCSSQLCFTRRASLTPLGSSRKSSLTSRRCSLNTSTLVSISSCGDYSEGENNEGTDKRILQSNCSIEADSAFEIETDFENQDNLTTMTDSIDEEGVKEEFDHLDLLQVPRKNLPKSRSLDMAGVEGKESAVRGIEKKGLKQGESLDSKLNTFDPGCLNVTKSNFVSLRMSNIEIPSCEKNRLSPVSSRSDSPISELGGSGGAAQGQHFGGLTSPFTDSDGIYDCGSSEVPGTSNIEKPNIQQQIRRSGNRKNRRITQPGKKCNNLCVYEGTKIFSITTPKVGIAEIEKVEGEFQRSWEGKGSRECLGPHGSIGNLSSSSEKLKRLSPKRRVRAQPNLDMNSSSSSESLNSVKSSSSRSRSPFRSSSSSPINVSREVLNENPGRISPQQRNKSPCPQESKDNLQCEKEGLKGPLSCVELPKSPARRKISRLRTISHQIRFLRRLEMSLMRKKEVLKIRGASKEEQREFLDCSCSESSESVCDSSEISEGCCNNEADQPILAIAESLGKRKRKGFVK